MAYTINKTDGSVVATITDGTVDNTTSVQLFGKSFSGFGEGLNENLVKLGCTDGFIKFFNAITLGKFISNEGLLIFLV